VGSPALRVVVCGGVLLSRTLSCAVPLALEGLASGFGMGPGVSRSAIAAAKSLWGCGHVGAPTLRWGARVVRVEPAACPQLVSGGWGVVSDVAWWA
jgi:hypothetical protein